MIYNEVKIWATVHLLTYLSITYVDIGELGVKVYNFI